MFAKQVLPQFRSIRDAVEVYFIVTDGAANEVNIVGILDAIKRGQVHSAFLEPVGSGLIGRDSHSCGRLVIGILSRFLQVVFRDFRTYQVRLGM